MEQKILKALVIDDDPIITKVLARVLTKRIQMEVREANSAKDALSLLEEDVPDLLIIDYMMPIMTGKDLIVLLKSDEKFRNIPIIVLSALNDSEIIQEIINLKVDDYIMKPVTPQLIHERVVKVLKNAREKKRLEMILSSSANALLYIGNNKDLFSGLIKIFENIFEIKDFENIPYKAINLYFQKFHRFVILEQQEDEIVNKVLIEKIKEANPNSVLIYLTDPNSNLLLLAQDRKNIPANLNEIFSNQITADRLGEIIKNYLKYTESNQS